MRKLNLQMNISLDGFVAGPEGELDWMTPEKDERQLAILKELTEGMDTILMGRKMADGFSNYWEHVVDQQPHNPEYPFAKIFVDTPKIVFSKTVKTVPGRNSTVENGDLIQAVNKLKSRPGKNLIAYGGAEFVSQLIKNGLVDELYLFVNPVAVGKGLKIFHDRTNFHLIRLEAYAGGVVLQQYRIKNS